MVIQRIREFLENRRQLKAEESTEEERLENYRKSQGLKDAEQIKKEADRLAHLKQYKHAIEEYLKALELFPYDAKEANYGKPAEFYFKNYYNIAASYSFLNNFKSSIEYFDKALEIEAVDKSNKVKALMAKGNCFFRAKQIITGNYDEQNMDAEFKIDEKAIEALKKSDSKENLLNIALKCYAKASELDKHNAEAWYRRGHIECLTGMVKEAIFSFDNVISIQKNFENKEGIELFDDIKREKGIEIRHSTIFENDLKFKTKTGHLVKNRAQMVIANFFFDNNLIFQYNVTAAWADKDTFKATFYLPKLDLYVEHFKYSHIKDYQKVMKWKIKQYDKYKKKLVHTTSEDEKNIEEALKIKLKPYIVLEDGNCINIIFCYLAHSFHSFTGIIAFYFLDFGDNKLFDFEIKCQAKNILDYSHCFAERFWRSALSYIIESARWKGNGK